MGLNQTLNTAEIFIQQRRRSLAAPKKTASQRILPINSYSIIQIHHIFNIQEVVLAIAP